LLTVINGYSALLKMRPLPEKRDRDAVQKVYTAGERAAGLIAQLMAFSRRQIVKPEVLDLSDLVTSMCDILERTIGEHIAIQTDLSTHLWLVEIDPTQMERVIVNLAVNARDAMPDGGQLILRTMNVTLDEDAVSFDPEFQPGQYVAVSVSDTGIGMSDEVRCHLFEPFFTTKEAGKGTGLGLATIHGLVKQAGGAIRVDSVQGRGTVFHVYLPRAEQDLSLQRAAPEHEFLPSGDETILLVEDDVLIRDLTHSILESQGYNVLEAEDGLEANRVAAGYAGRIHLLLSDVILPGGNGNVVADRLLQTRPNTKVLFMSGYTDDAIDHHGVLDPGVNFIPKPFTPEDLLHKVRAVLDGSDQPSIPVSIVAPTEAQLVTGRLRLPKRVAYGR
jgi:CheY-like chemotaxis protein